MERRARPGDTPELSARRKQNHIDLCAREDVESHSERSGGFFLAPEAMPDFAPENLDLSQSFLEHSFSLPLLITGMTGGVQDGQRINEIFARAAEQWNIPMGLGSQKMMVTDPSLRRLFDVRKVAPKVFLIGNMGAVSFNHGVTCDDIARLVDDLELNSFALHLNALQEQIQPEGERDFSSVCTRIEELVRRLPVPVMVKEVGSGMTAESCRRLLECGVAAVDVGGRGGTSWSVIEGHRGDRLTFRLGQLFRDWGLSTVESVVECAPVVGRFGTMPERALVATGGIRDGWQTALMLALGARMCGVGLPFFRAVVNPPDGLSAEESLQEEIEFFARSLEIAMFCCGARRTSDLPARLRKRNPQ